MAGKPLEDSEAAQLYGDCWRSPDTMPGDQTVEILTVRGRVRRVRRGRWPPTGGEKDLRRICCTGDRMAVAWRPLAEDSVRQVRNPPSADAEIMNDNACRFATSMEKAR